MNPFNRLGNLLSIRTGEGRTASLTIGVMLLTAAGASLGGTAIEALFFARFGVDYLPYMFIGLGVTSMITSFGITAALGKIPRGVLYVSLPLLIAMILLIARFALLTNLNWLYPTLWLGKEILNSLIGILIWGIASTVCDTRQAKRLFPLFNASRILGQVIGGFVTGILVGFVGTENLIAIWAGAMLMAFLLIRALLANISIPSTTPKISRRKQPALIEEMQRGYRYVRGSSLMRWVSFAAILFSVLYFSIALPFSRTITERFPREEELASFIGLFNGLSTAAAFGASLFLANRLFARIGIMMCILALPLIYLAGFGSLAIYPVFAIVIGFRFVQMLWLSGIADPAYQAMFNVVPPERRDQVRTFIGGVPEQAGTFIAGAILIIGEQTLAPQQLYFIGIFAAVLCTYVIFRARQGYNTALVDALRAGRPHLFFSEEQPFGGFRQDVAAVQTAMNGLRDPDPAIRRVSAEILGHLSIPEATSTIVEGLSDSDSLVRAACLRALTSAQATSALLDIAASLHDPEPDVRFEAVSSLSALAGYSSGLSIQLTPLLADDDPRVSTQTALSILKLSSKINNGDESELYKKAKTFLYSTALQGDLSARTHALTALGEWGDTEAFNFILNELNDQTAPAPIRRAAATALVYVKPEQAIPHLINILGDKDQTLRTQCAVLLGKIGAPALEQVLESLKDPTREEGALLALDLLPRPPSKPIEEYARAAISRAMEYDALWRGIRLEVQNDAVNLLIDSLHHKSHEYGIRALQAIGLLGDREAMSLAIENLQAPDASQRANVLEALDSIGSKWRDMIQPLMRLWEDDHTEDTNINWERLLSDNDPWIRECAGYAYRNIGETKMDTIATLSLMDRILFFKRVPLFADLSPSDLKQVSAIATEDVFLDGEIIAQEGEQGDTMFVIISGEVRVCTMKGMEEVEIARRKPNEYVGEMALISHEPRMATLTALGDVRTLCIDHKSFSGLIRERPDVSLAVMRELSKRLKESARMIEQLKIQT